MATWRSGEADSRRALVLAAALTAGVAAVVRLWPKRRQWPLERCSPRVEIYRAERVASSKLRPGFRSFPPPFPNGWVFVCPSEALPVQKVLPLSLCGRHLVAFRTATGDVGVLDAFCSHMGTHMGYGGYVSDQCIVCPYHEWKFDREGSLKHIPYAPNGGQADCARARNNMRSYPVKERHGMIWVWIHADNAEPWEFDPVLQQVEDLGLRQITRIIDDDFLMHPMEPSHNSTDWYHFQTVHSTLSQHWLSRWKWASILQTIRPARSAVDNSIDDDGKPITQKEVLIIDEEVKEMKLFNGWISIPGSRFEKLIKTQVRFSGPLLAVFKIEIASLGLLLVYMPITPVEPFVSHLEFWSFASRGFPYFLAYILTHFIRETVNQDREVWERRVHLMPRNIVKGDFNHNRYDLWLKSFYSENSIKWDDPDLTW